MSPTETAIYAISMDQLFDHTKKLGPKDLVLDVRSADEFADGHVPGSKNIPVDEVEFRAKEIAGTQNLYVYCRAGRRAGMACAVLHKHGFDKLGFQTVYVVDEGGFPDWEDAKFPIQK